VKGANNVNVALMIHWLNVYLQRRITYCASFGWTDSKRFIVTLNIILVFGTSCAGWSGSMLVANRLCWFCRYTAQILFFVCRVVSERTGRETYIQELSNPLAPTTFKTTYYPRPDDAGIFTVVCTQTVFYRLCFIKLFYLFELSPVSLIGIFPPKYYLSIFLKIRKHNSENKTHKTRWSAPIAIQSVLILTIS
jgi:hypothetical protein